jgi:transposase
MAKKRDHKEMERRRRRAAALFDKGLAPAEVARRLGVHRQSACRWRERWQQGGVAALASKGAAGRKPRLGAAQTAQLVEALLAGPLAAGHATDLWTLPRVAALIEQRFGQRYHRGHCWHLLRRLGFSCQRPTRRALERDEKKIAAWKRSTWPALKKNPARGAHHHLHRRKRAEHPPAPGADLGAARANARPV